jgi:hypothetical protein
MQNSASPSGQPRDSAARKGGGSRDDAYNPTSHRDDYAGCDRGIRGRVAELPQPGTGAAAAGDRSDRDPFAARGRRSSVLRPGCPRRRRRLSRLGGSKGDGARTPQRWNRSRRSPHRGNLARTPAHPVDGGAPSQAGLFEIPLYRGRGQPARDRPRRPPGPE